MSPESYFNFESKSEEEEKLDYSQLKPCPNCQKPIAQDATLCYFCGQSVDRQKKSLLAVWIVIGLIIIFMIASLF